MNSEIWLRAQYQAVLKERDFLQNQLDLKQKENEDLRKSVFELNYMLQSSGNQSLRIAERFNHEIITNYHPLIRNHPRLIINSSSSHLDTLGSDNEQSFRFDTELKGHSGAIYSIAFAPCGKWLASGGIDRSVRYQIIYIYNI
jgi:COMPASS component SWD3